MNEYRFAQYGLARCFQWAPLRFQGRALRVTEADEPSNLLRDDWTCVTSQVPRFDAGADIGAAVVGQLNANSFDGAWALDMLPADLLPFFHKNIECGAGCARAASRPPLCRVSVSRRKPPDARPPQTPTRSSPSSRRPPRAPSG